MLLLVVQHKLLSIWLFPITSLSISCLVSSASPTCGACLRRLSCLSYLSPSPFGSGVLQSPAPAMEPDEGQLAFQELGYTAPAEPGTLKVLPKGKVHSQRIVVGDSAGVLQSFMYNQGQKVMAFRTTATKIPVRAFMPFLRLGALDLPTFPLARRSRA